MAGKVAGTQLAAVPPAPIVPADPAGTLRQPRADDTARSWRDNGEWIAPKTRPRRRSAAFRRLVAIELRGCSGNERLEDALAEIAEGEGHRVIDTIAKQVLDDAAEL